MRINGWKNEEIQRTTSILQKIIQIIIFNNSIGKKLRTDETI